MSLIRMVFIAGSLAVAGGSSYLAFAGVGGESTGIERSVRAGSAGNIINSSVK